MSKSFPLYTQLDSMDCGPTCLRMISKHYGRTISIDVLRKKSYNGREGVSLWGISEAAESIGFRTTGLTVALDQLTEAALFPYILHWKQNHFIVFYGFKNNRFYIADPVGQKVSLSKDEFLKSWLTNHSDGEQKGVALVLEPSPDFFEADFEEPVSRSYTMSFLLNYFKPYRRLVLQLFLSLLIGSLIQLIFPFLTQSIVDVGINTRDISFIYLLLAGQLMFFFSRTAVEFLRRWILLHLSTRVNIAIVSDFLIKLMKLPLSYFDSKMVGDLIQRINDHQRLQNFLSSASLSILFSFFNLVIFGVVLLYYNTAIFLVFLSGSFFYVAYVLLFLKKRKELDYRRFNQLSINQNSLIQLIQGISDIKLNGAEKVKRWEWEKIQAKLFRVEIGSTQLTQYQEAGSLFINELKNILITFMAARAVIDGQMTMGMMLAVQYIIGQLTVPINESVTFLRHYQDAKISLERIGEVHKQTDEEIETGSITYRAIPQAEDIRVKEASFFYEGPNSTPALDEVSLDIEKGKVTAIVGSSGSGKTTLLKMLLKFYAPSTGKITLGTTDFKSISAKEWRSMCGVVMQDGYLFADTIARNIALGDENINISRLVHATGVANIHEHIESLPQGYNTRIGNQGAGLSQGQRQRLLIARAVYKDPSYLFFDEATSALDSRNESQIIDNLMNFFKERTVVVIAHRLSTVKNADQIIVMEKGKVIERGSHQKLVAERGMYFELVRNQLDLDH